MKRLAMAAVLAGMAGSPLLAGDVLVVSPDRPATVQIAGASGAWPVDGAIAAASAGEGTVLILGRAAGRTKIIVATPAGMNELDVEVAASDGEQQRVEGDILLGIRGGLRDAATQSVVIPGSSFRWSNCVVPFTVDRRLPDPGRVTAAIAHWEAHTNYRFVPRTKEADFVTFEAGSGCASAVGRRGGQQVVILDAVCTTGNAIHEIAHTVGLWHEQSRADRDQFVRINFAKVRQESVHNFDQHITDGDDLGPYDYDSIMHYPRTAFSVDGSDTVVPLNPRADIGQRVGLSPGDVAAANSLCQLPPPETDGKRRATGH